MSSEEYPQVRIVPIRMLQPDNAEKFLDGLSSIAGIRRVLVHGPGHLKESSKNPQECCTIEAPAATNVRISNQNMDMHVLMGDVIVEALDERALNTIAQYCEDFFGDFAFQILVGKFIKTAPSLSDYITKNPNTDPYNPYYIGMYDNRPLIQPTLIRQN